MVILCGLRTITKCDPIVLVKNIYVMINNDVVVRETCILSYCSMHVPELELNYIYRVEYYIVERSG